jgi:ribosomal protein S18 acetylase RimI-like enzyme
MSDLRPAVPADARTLAEIHVAGWRFAYRGLVPDAELDALSVERREAMWSGVLARATSGPYRVWVAEREGRVVGFVSTGPSRDDDAADGAAELYAIYLDPAWVGAGLGRALTEQALADVAARGATHVTLWVLEGNARARTFYEKAGFALDGATKAAQFGEATLTELRYRRAV